MRYSESTPFRHTIDELDHWLDDVSSQMGGVSRSVANHALRGVLTALRDCLPLQEAHRLAEDLPVLVRTVYFQGYRPLERPIPTGYRQFLAHVRAELRAGGSDDAEGAVRAVLDVLDRRLGEPLERAWALLPSEIASLREMEAELA